MINLNFSQKAEYKLFNDQTYEYIRMYGIPCKLILTKKCGRDGVFGDYTHYEVDNAKAFQIYGLPENAESFDTQQYMFEDYGISDYNTCNIFVSTYDFDEKHSNLKLNEIIGNFVVLPSGKVMEITHVDYMTPHLNNLFAYADRKSVYKLTLDPYEFRVQDQINHEELKHNDPEFKDSSEVDQTVQNNVKIVSDEILDDATKKYSEVLKTGDPSSLADLFNDLKETEEDKEDNSNNSKYDALDGYFDRLVKIKEDVDKETVELTGVNEKVVEDIKPNTIIEKTSAESTAETHLNPKTQTELKTDGPIETLNKPQTIHSVPNKLADLNNISALPNQKLSATPIYPKRKVSKYTGF